MSATSSGSTGDFETPGSGAGEPDATGDENGRETFEEPSEAALGSAAADQDLAAETAGYGADITALKAEIEKSLSGKVAEGASYEVQTLDGDNVVGVGLTSVDAEDLVSGAAATGLPGENALAIFTVERTDAEKMQAAVASMAGTSALSTMPLVQIPVGVVDIQPHRFRIRPAPGGVSWGHFRITAGTLGCLVRGNRPPRDRRLMGLTNNHVGANSNNASLGDCIAQPGMIQYNILSLLDLELHLQMNHLWSG